MSYEMMTLRLANTPTSLLESSSSGFFSARVPENLRNKPALVRVQSGMVTNLDNIFPAGVDVNSIFIRSNLSTNSYDTTTKGNNLMLGTIVRPLNTEKVGSIDIAGVSDFGSSILPPVIEIELFGVVTAKGELVRLSLAASNIEVVLGLEYEK